MRWTNWPGSRSAPCCSGSSSSGCSPWRSGRSSRRSGDTATDRAGIKRIRKRLGSAGRAITYAAIAIAAVDDRAGQRRSGDNKEEGWTARLLSAPVRSHPGHRRRRSSIIVLGVRLVRRGITKKFTDDLAGGVGQEVVRLGQAGYIVKGIAFVIVGGLFGWAAITYDAEKAGGLDDALRTVNEAPSARCC